MKPTQQEIIEQLGEAFDRAVEICGREFVANSLLERFGAGGGGREPVARLMTWIGMDVYPKKGSTVARTYRECPKDAYPDRWEEGPELYTHPSPTDLRAEYVRGLEDAASIVENADTPDCGGWTTCGIAEEIRTLKGKQ